MERGGGGGGGGVRGLVSVGVGSQRRGVGGEERGIEWASSNPGNGWGGWSDHPKKRGISRLDREERERLVGGGWVGKRGGTNAIVFYHATGKVVYVLR